MRKMMTFQTISFGLVLCVAAQVVHALPGIPEPVLVVGHSWGGSYSAHIKELNDAVSAFESQNLPVVNFNTFSQASQPEMPVNRTVYLAGDAWMSRLFMDDLIKAQPGKVRSIEIVCVVDALYDLNRLESRNAFNPSSMKSITLAERPEEVREMFVKLAQSGGRPFVAEFAGRGKNLQSVSRGSGDDAIFIRVNLTSAQQLDNLSNGGFSASARRGGGKKAKRSGGFEVPEWLKRSMSSFDGDNKEDSNFGDHRAVVSVDPATKKLAHLAWDASGSPNGDKNQDFRINLKSDNVQGYGKSSGEVSYMGKNHGLSGKYMQVKAGLKDHNLFRGAYLNRMKYGRFENAAAVKVGYLMSRTGRKNSWGREDTQQLAGVEDKLSYTLQGKRTNLRFETGYGAVYSKPNEDKMTLDHTRYGGGVSAGVNLTKKIDLNGSFEANSFNGDWNKYFFVTRKNTQDVLFTLRYVGDALRGGVLGGWTTSDSYEDDKLTRKLGGWVKMGRAGMKGIMLSNERVNEYIGAVSYDMKKYTLEAFVNRNSYKDRGYQNTTYAGLAINVGFGGGKEAPDARDYRSGPESDHYAERFYKDHDISLAQATQRVGDSLRKANEWSGSNYTWVEGIDPSQQFVRSPEETYGGRAGDCDEQAWSIAKILNDNKKKYGKFDGEAYILDYFRDDKWTGHAATLVEQMVDGKKRVFVNEYGENYLVDVDPNASREEKVKAAMEQVAPFLALSPGKGVGLDYRLYGTENKTPADWGYDMGYLFDPKTDWQRIDSFQATRSKPKIETGVEALLGRDGF
ncbi:MAG: hypothetical protein HY611_10260 [Elusimicrobia bacterium]|nr:hypothetical protein [Elusimicrobiota bacterium]